VPPPVFCLQSAAAVWPKSSRRRAPPAIINHLEALKAPLVRRTSDRLCLFKCFRSGERTEGGHRRRRRARNTNRPAARPPPHVSKDAAQEVRPAGHHLQTVTHSRKRATEPSAVAAIRPAGNGHRQLTIVLELVDGGRRQVSTNALTLSLTHTHCRRPQPMPAGIRVAHASGDKSGPPRPLGNSMQLIRPNHAIVSRTAVVVSRERPRCGVLPAADRPNGKQAGALRSMARVASAFGTQTDRHEMLIFFNKSSGSTRRLPAGGLQSIPRSQVRCLMDLHTGRRCLCVSERACSRRCAIGQMATGLHRAAAATTHARGGGDGSFNFERAKRSRSSRRGAH
jgi:hypothetical protein